MTMHYRVDPTHLHVRLEQIANPPYGWLAVGFSPKPNQMVGATAIIGTREWRMGVTNAPSVKPYYLGGTSTDDVSPLPASSQDFFMEIEARSMFTSVSFSLPHSLGLVGVGTTDTHLIFARGASNTLGYHEPKNTASLTISLDVPHAPPMPRLPNEIEVVIVTVTLTVAAPDYSFGEATLAKLKWRLAAALGVTTSAVTLSIVSSFPYRRLSERDSIDIRATIHFTDEPAATAAVDKLELYAADPQAASTALGVPITSVAAPLATTTWMTKSPPNLPPSPPAQPTVRANVGSQGLSASESDTGLLVGVIVGAVCGVLLLGGLYYYRKRRRDKEALPPPPLTPPPAPPSTAPPAEAKPKKKRQRGTVLVKIGSSRMEDAPEDAEGRTFSMKVGSSRDQKPPPPPCPPPGPPPPEAELPPLPDHDDATVARI